MLNDISDVSENSNTSTVIEFNSPEKNDVNIVETPLDVFGDIVDKSMSAFPDSIKPAMLSNRRHSIIATIDEDMSEHLPDIISTTNNNQSKMINEEPEQDPTIVEVVPNDLILPLAEIPYQILLSSSEQSDSTGVTDDVTICSSTESANTSSRSDERGEERGDDLTDVENFHLSAYGEDSLEAMYYSLRKNDIEVDKQQQNKQKYSEDINESEELSTSEEIEISDDKHEICSTKDGNESHLRMSNIEDINIQKAEESSEISSKYSEIDNTNYYPYIKLENEIEISQEILIKRDNMENTDSGIIERQVKLETPTDTGEVTYGTSTRIEQPNSDIISSTIDMILTDASNLAEHVIRSEQVTDLNHYKDMECEEEMIKKEIAEPKVEDTDGLPKIMEQDEVVPNTHILTQHDMLSISQANIDNINTSVDLQSGDTKKFQEISPISIVSIESPANIGDQETISDTRNNLETNDTTDPIAIAMHKQRQLLDRMHGSTIDDFDQTDFSERPDIRHNMWTSSIVSETDSDYNDVDQKPPLLHKDDFNISTAIGHTSATSSTDTSDTQTATTIVSAVTLIQAGARGFLTRRRLRRSSGATTNTTLPGGESAVPQQPGSFGNAAITASLDAMVERHELLKMDTAARIIQRFYRRRQQQQSVVIDQTENDGQVLQTMGLASNDAIKCTGTNENDQLDRSSSKSAVAIVSSVVDYEVPSENAIVGIGVGDGDDTVDNCVRTRSEENTISVNISPAATAQQQYDVHGPLKIAANDAQNAPTNQLSIAGGVGSSGGSDSGCGVEVLVSDETVSPMTTIPSSRLDSEEAHQQRRLTLQRGDAVQRNSTPDDGQDNELNTSAITCEPKSSVVVQEKAVYSAAITGDLTSSVVVNEEMVTVLEATTVTKNSTRS